MHFTIASIQSAMKFVLIFMFHKFLCAGLALGSKMFVYDRNVHMSYLYYILRCHCLRYSIAQVWNTERRWKLTLKKTTAPSENCVLKPLFRRGNASGTCWPLEFGLQYLLFCGPQRLCPCPLLLKCWDCMWLPFYVHAILGSVLPGVHCITCICCCARGHSPSLYAGSYMNKVTC